jgi:hypothetical protein
VAIDAKVAAGYILFLGRAFMGVVAIGLKMLAIGKAIDDGLASGILAGIPKVIGAIKGLGAAALGALKSALAIASPSKEFAKLGAFTAAGFTAGIKSGTGGVRAASSGMAASAAQGAAGATGKAAAGGGKTVHFHFAAGAIQTGGGQQGGQGVGLTEVDVAAVFERVALAQGLGGTGG